MHENCVSREEFNKLEERNRWLEARIEELEKRNRELEALLLRFIGPNAPPSTRDLRYPRREPTGKPLGKPKGSKGATRKLGEPDERIRVKRERCRKCGSKLGECIGVEKHLKVDLPPPQKPIVTEFELEKYFCAGCGVENVASDPRCPTKGDYGPRALALVQDVRFRERLSIALTCRFLRERFGFKISPSGVLDLTSRTVRMLRDSENELVMRIKLSDVVYVDETGFYINGKRVWLWIFATYNDVLVVIRESRGSNVPRKILGRKYRGTIVCDCFSAYDLLKKQLPNARFQKCWAHLLRESKACSQQCGEDGLMMHKELKAFFSRMKAFLQTQPPPDARQKELKEAIEWLDKMQAAEYKHPRVKKLLKRLGKYREDWFTCIEIPNVEPTNNRAERSLRPHVILRRLRGSLRSDRGREDHEAMTSLMATWELQGLDPAMQLENELRNIFDKGY